MTDRGRTILVIGATGRQGGAVARRLLARSWAVRALTRDASKVEAQALRELGAEVVQGDMEDRGSLERALEGAYGVFGVQDYWEHGYEGEVRQGKILAEAAEASHVSHFVQTTVGGAERSTGIPHFESKWEIEEHLRALDLPWTILRPVSFMENFLMPFYREDILSGVLKYALPGDRRHQLIAVDDIGVFGAMAFENPAEYLGRALEIAGDHLSMAETADKFGKVLGRPVRFQEKPIEELRRSRPESAAMHDWFLESGYQADIPALRALHPKLMDLETWMQRTGWGQRAN
ncbi:MAG: NmrA/HSCARG family protein [Anaerolineae bacterium]